MVKGVLKQYLYGASEPSHRVGFEMITRIQGLIKMLTLLRSERNTLCKPIASSKFPLLQRNDSARYHEKSILVVGQK